MKKITLSIFIVFLIISCSNRRKEQPQIQPPINQTPEIFQETKIIDEIGKYSSRYKSNVISNLYSEALEKNNSLRELDSRIKEMNSIKNDSLDSYNQYHRINQQYWSSANNLLSQLNDSILRESTKELFNRLESDYKKRISNHEANKQLINKYEVSLKDQHLLMQLIVTAPMMVNFQRNEKPSIDGLKNLIKEYEMLLQESKEYTTINK